MNYFISQKYTLAFSKKTLISTLEYKTTELEYTNPYLISIINLNSLNRRNSVGFLNSL